MLVTALFLRFAGQFRALQVFGVLITRSPGDPITRSDRDPSPSASSGFGISEKTTTLGNLQVFEFAASRAQRAGLIKPMRTPRRLPLLCRSFRGCLPDGRNQGFSFLWHGDALALENLLWLDFLAVEVLVGVTIDTKRHA